MKHSVLVLTLASLLLQQKCDLRSFTSPEAIKAQVEEQVQGYFPNAKAEVVPQIGAILAMTCVKGVSPQFVERMMRAMAQDPSITQPLGKLQYLPLLGGAKYKYFVLSFDSGWIWYDLEAKQLSLRDMPEGAVNGYQQECGFAESQN